MTGNFYSIMSILTIEQDANVFSWYIIIAMKDIIAQERWIIYFLSRKGNKLLKKWKNTLFYSKWIKHLRAIASCKIGSLTWCPWWGSSCTIGWWIGSSTMWISADEEDCEDDQDLFILRMINFLIINNNASWWGINFFFCLSYFASTLVIKSMK